MSRCTPYLFWCVYFVAMCIFMHQILIKKKYIIISVLRRKEKQRIVQKNHIEARQRMKLFRKEVMKTSLQKNKRISTQLQRRMRLISLQKTTIFRNKLRSIASVVVICGSPIYCHKHGVNNRWSMASRSPPLKRRILSSKLAPISIWLEVLILSVSGL